MGASRKKPKQKCSVHLEGGPLSERYSKEEEDLIKGFTQPGYLRVTRWQDLADTLNKVGCSCIVRTEGGVAQKWRRMMKDGKIPQPCTLINGHPEDVPGSVQPYVQPDSLQTGRVDHDDYTTIDCRPTDNQIASLLQSHPNGGWQFHYTQSYIDNGQGYLLEMVPIGSQVSLESSLLNVPYNL